VFTDDEERAEHGFYLLGYVVKLFHGVGRNGYVKRKFIKALNSFDQLFLKAPGVLELCLCGRVDDSATFYIG